MPSRELVENVIEDCLKSNYTLNIETVLKKVLNKLDINFSGVQQETQFIISVGKQISDKQFKHAINIVHESLKNQQVEIICENYDGVIVKELKRNNVYNVDGSGQTHIELSKAQRDMFPHLESEGYFDREGDNTSKYLYTILKNYFLLQIPVAVNQRNLTYLEGGDITSEDDILMDSCTTVVYDNRARVEIASQFDFDGPCFDKFHKSLKIRDYMIILKRKSQFSYEVYGISADDVDDELRTLNNKFFYFDSKTPVTLDIYDNNPYFETDFKRNRIFFGAPGTGKSFNLDSDRKQLLEGHESNFERVTFHPDYSYANFVGTYKPVSKDQNGKNIISYDYVPGPFLRILINAMDKKDEPHLLIIEEINRSNVAAVFGDIFQLLDRDDKGISEYSIQTSHDMRKHLAEELGGDEDNYKSIKIPSNMFIWATMNSADQGVFLLDSAFKRRWDFEYISIDKGESEIAGKHVFVGNNKIQWNKLRKAINSELISYGINEDKLLGPFFIPPRYLEEDNEENGLFNDIFKNKVLMYLFEDVAKHKRNKLFSNVTKINDYLLYSKVCEEFDKKGIRIFSKNIIDFYYDNQFEIIGD